MSRDDSDQRPMRESSFSSSGEGANQDHRTSSQVRAVPSDRLLPREFVLQVYNLAIRDAELLQDAERVSDRWLAAAEIGEFGLGDPDVAETAASLAADAPSVDARVFSTLRRGARAQSDSASLRGLYAKEATRGRSPRDRVLAELGGLLLDLRNGGEAKDAIPSLSHLKPQIEGLESEIVAVWRSISEDALVVLGKPDRATELRAQRFKALVPSEDSEREEERAAVALTTAALAEHAALPESDVLSWFDAAFQIDASTEAARPIFRWAWRHKKYEILDAMLLALAERSDDPDVRGSANYQLGMLRAHVLGDVKAGLAALSQSSASGVASGLGASAFLSLARSSHGSAVPDEVVDALTARLSFAASGMESADLLTQMAERFDVELELSDAAVDMAREALQQCPHWTPALRLLGSIYARDGHWEQLIELQTSQLEFERDPDERRKLHERIAEVAHDRLRRIPLAEEHLIDALSHGWHAPTAQRLARIYRELSRWEDLFQHQIRAAAEAPVQGERLRLLEEAAAVAEDLLHDAERAIAAWSQALEVDPSHTTAIAALERIFLKHHRWDELLRLCEHELALVGEGNESARLTLLCRCAEIALQRLADHHAAEEFYRRALQLNPLYDDALRGLGLLLKNQGRWHDLIAMTEQEHDRAISPERRAKCLRQIGELYVRQLNDLESGLGAYRRLGALGAEWHEEALLWLERLYEATGDATRLLQVMRGRRELAKDEAGQARLSFRMAEVLEWKLGQHAEALREYIVALDEPSVSGEVVAAMERCLASKHIPSETRIEALDALSQSLSNLPDSTCRVALDLLLSQARSQGDGDAVDSLLDVLQSRWGSDRLVAEMVALRQLARAEWDEAEQSRSVAMSAGPDAMRSLWRVLDDEGLLDESALNELEQPALRAWVLREAGELGEYFGADDRELLMLVQRSELSIGELVTPHDSWISRNLAVFASRALQDSKGLQEGLESLAEAAGEPLLAMRLWLDAAGEGAVPAVLRHKWLRRAAAAGNFGHPLREDVYRALQTTGDIDGLVLALREHIESGAAQGEELANLALRLGRALDGLQRREEAVAALRLAMVHDPASASIALEKSRVESLSGDLHAARSTLEAVLTSGCPEASRKDVLLRLTDLHALDGGDRARGIEALEEAFVLSGRSRELGLRLSEMHLQFGDATRGAALLESLLDPSMVEEELRLWITLGRTYALRLNKVEKAEALLWDAVDRFPERTEPLTQLEELALRTSRHSEFAHALRARLERTDSNLSKERRANLWMHLGSFQMETLSRPEEAEHSFEAAVEAGANRGQAQLQRARAVSQQAGRSSDAAALIVDAVHAKDFQLRSLPDVVGELDRLYVESGETSHLRTVRQLRKTLGHSTPEVGLAERRALEEPLNDGVLYNLLGADMLSPRERFVLVESSGLAQRVFVKKGDLSNKTESTRYRAENFRYFDDHLRHACEMFGMEVPRLSVAVNGIYASTADGVHFLVPGPRITDDQPAAAKFWAGWVAAIAYSKLGAYSQLEDQDIRELLSAVAHRSGDEVAPSLRGLVDEIGALLWLGQRRSAETAHRGAPEVALASGEGRAQAIRSIGDRFGAAYCDHPGVALYELLRAGGIPLSEGVIPTEVLRNSPRALHLVRFLLSPQYLRLREGIGVGPRSTQLSHA